MSGPDPETWRITLPDGASYGPVDAAVLQEWILAGRVPADALVWRAGWPEWRRAGDSEDELPARLPAGETDPPVAAGGSHGPSYALKRRRRAARRQTLLIALAVACLLLAAMLGWLMLTGPVAGEPTPP